MIEIKFKVGGREVRPDQIGDAIERAIVEGIAEEVGRKLGHIRCAEHGQHPRVTATGSSFERLKLVIEGCCQELEDKASKALQ